MKAYGSIGEAISSAMQHNIDLVNDHSRDGLLAGAIETGREKGLREAADDLTLLISRSDAPVDRGTLAALAEVWRSV